VTIKHAEAFPRAQRIALGFLKVFGDHLVTQVGEGDLRLPAQFSRALLGSPNKVSTSVGRK
jgi:hypothetical protein